MIAKRVFFLFPISPISVHSLHGALEGLISPQELGSPSLLCFVGWSSSRLHSPEPFLIS